MGKPKITDKQTTSLSEHIDTLAEDAQNSDVYCVWYRTQDGGRIITMQGDLCDVLQMLHDTTGMVCGDGEDNLHDMEPMGCA